MSHPEIPLLFNCQNENLLGIVHLAESDNTCGVLIVVGGPQYRVGSHRQFVLLARMLAEQGFSVMRFDHRGIGNASGEPRSFAQLDDDIHSAIDEFMQQCPKLKDVVIWGLCDAASAALFYAVQDVRVKGLVLLNPWVYTEHGEAKSYLKHYYVQRLLSRDFWTKVIRLKFNYRESFSSLINLCSRIFSNAKANNSALKEHNHSDDNSVSSSSLPDTMLQCLQSFQYPVLFILSGQDLTADQFRDLLKSDHRWQHLLAEGRVLQHELRVADHTFSSAEWRDQVAEWTYNWLCQIKS